MVDIYLVGDTEYGHDSSRVETSSKLDMYLNQIRMLMNTQKGSILGYEDFGVDIEGLVFEKDLNENSIKTEIEDHIKLYCSLNRDFTTNVVVKFFRGVSRDMCVIDIFIDGSKMITEVLK